MNAEQYVTARARQMSGASDAPGMPAYPLYGLGQIEDVVWYRRPMIVFPVGVAVGLGLGYFLFMVATPMAKNWAGKWASGGRRVKRNKRPKIEVDEGDEE